MKPLIVFHEHCTDGFGAAFAAWKKFGDEAEYLPMSYNAAPLIQSTYAAREVYILDFSFSKEITLEIMKHAKRVVWLDHHKTAFEMWRGRYEKGLEFYDTSTDNYIALDDNRSGALIAWHYFHPCVEVPMLIKHIDDRDRWQFKLEGSKELHAALASYKPWSFEMWAELNAQLNNWDDIVGPHYIFKEGSAILRAHEQNVKSAVGAGKRGCRIIQTEPKIGGEHWEANTLVDATGLSANCTPHLASDVGHELANESGTFGLCWYMGDNGKAKCSLRSNGDYDVSAIAKAFGGGGHQNASGFEVDMSTLMGWMK